MISRGNLLIAVVAMGSAVPPALAAQASVSREMIRRVSKNRTSVLLRVRGTAVDTIRGDATVVGRTEILTSVDPAAAPVPSPTDAKRLDLPIQGVAGIHSVARAFHVVVELGTGLAYDHTASLFRGRVFVGLEDAEHQGEPAAGFEPLELQVFGADSVAPPMLSLDHFDIPFKQLDIASRSATDSVRVRFRPTGQPAVTVAIPVHLVPLRLSASAQRVGGLGVDAVSLSLPFPDEFGGDSVTVVIEGDGISATPSSVLLNRAAPTGAVAVVRSTGLGKRRITARGPHFTRPAPLDLEFVLPWSFIVSALLGGIAGGLVRRATGGRTGRSIRQWTMAALVGAFVGMVVAGLFVNGVNLLGIALTIGSSELVTFAVAAVGGLAGVTLLLKFAPGPAPP